MKPALKAGFMQDGQCCTRRLEIISNLFAHFPRIYEKGKCFNPDKSVAESVAPSPRWSAEKNVV